MTGRETVTPHTSGELSFQSLKYLRWQSSEEKRMRTCVHQPSVARGSSTPCHARGPFRASRFRRIAQDASRTPPTSLRASHSNVAMSFPGRVQPPSRASGRLGSHSPNQTWRRRMPVTAEWPCCIRSSIAWKCRRYARAPTEVRLPELSRGGGKSIVVHLCESAGQLLCP